MGFKWEEVLVIYKFRLKEYLKMKIKMAFTFLK